MNWDNYFYQKWNKPVEFEAGYRYIYRDRYRHTCFSKCKGTSLSVGIPKAIERRRSTWSFPNPLPSWLIGSWGLESRSTLLGQNSQHFLCLCTHLRNPVRHQREGRRSEFGVWVKLCLSEQMSSGSWAPWLGSNPDLSLTSYATWGKCLQLPLLPIPQLEHGDNYSMFLKGLLWGLNEEHVQIL